MFFKKKVNENKNIFFTKISALLIHAAKIDENYTNEEEEIIKKTRLELGLHEDLTNAVLDVYFKKKDTILALYKQKEFKLETIEKVDWRVDCVLGSSNIQGMAEPNIMLKIKGSNSNDDVSFDMSSNMFRVLHAELKNAHTMMIQMSGSDD